MSLGAEFNHVLNAYPKYRGIVLLKKNYYTVIIIFIFLLLPVASKGTDDDSLVVYYTFDSITPGIGVRDMSGKGNHLKKVNADSLSSKGRFNKALKTDRGYKAQHSESLALAEGSGLTICLWIKFTKNKVRWNGLVKKAVSPDNNQPSFAYLPFNGYILGTSGTNVVKKLTEKNFRFTVSGNGKKESVEAGPIADFVIIGQWSHIAASYNPSPDDRGLRIYINGELVIDRVMINMPTNISNTAPLVVGKDLSPFPGEIDELRIYNQVLTDENIRRRCLLRSMKLLNQHGALTESQR